MWRKNPGKTGVLIISALLIAGLAPTQAGAAGVSAPGSIDPTGKRDVTTALQAFLDKVPDNSTIRFPKNARYRIEGTLVLANRKNLSLVGQGATFYATTRGDRSRGQWRVVDSTNITFYWMVIRGASVTTSGAGDDKLYLPELEGQHGINVSGSTNVTIAANEISHVWGDLIYVGNNSKAVKIHHNNLHHSSRQGIAVTGGDGIRVERNLIWETRRATFDLEPHPTRAATGIRIAENWIGKGRLLFIAGHGPGYVGDVTVENNRLFGKTMSISIKASSTATSRRSGFKIVGNTTDAVAGSPGGSAIAFDGVANIDVRNNTQPMQRGRNMYMVKVTNACNVRVSGNVVTDGAGQLQSGSAPAC